MDFLKPASEADLAQMIRDARGSLAVRGGGTRGAPHLAEQILSTEELTGIQLYEPGALTVVARAGTPLSEVEATLASEGQRLAMEPPDMRSVLGRKGTPTIGGIVAANAAGPRRVQSGAVRDFLLGVRFVDGAGTIISNGGRVMKNVTGYDLVRLMAGSHGTLGVLSEVALKVLPKPASQALLIFSDLGVSDAVDLMSAALATPYEVTAAAHAPVGPDGSPVTYLRVEGSDASVTYRTSELAGQLGGWGTPEVVRDHAEAVEVMEWVRDAGPFQGTSGDLWKISVKPTDAPGVVEALGAEGVLLDWGGGRIWAEVAPGTDLRARFASKGHTTLVRAELATHARLGTFQPEAAPVAAISDGLRAKFDPKGILNPGLMGRPRAEVI
ncbi:MAG: FAD-binding protein [Pseudomonadota bacterium]